MPNMPWHVGRHSLVTPPTNPSADGGDGVPCSSVFTGRLEAKKAFTLGSNLKLHILVAGKRVSGWRV